MSVGRNLVLSSSLIMTFVASLFGATWAVAGDRDFPVNYQSLDGCAKQEYLWDDRIEPSTYTRLPAVTGSWASLFSSISSILFLNQTFDHTSDALPGGRQKIIHSHGSVAKIEIEIDDSSPFSGVYAPGKSCGLARLSLAGSESALGYTPGMGLKIFLDSKASVNFHVMNSLNGQGRNRNFFAKTFTNWLPQPNGFTLNSIALAIAVTGRELNRLPIAHGARVSRDGKQVSVIKTPKQIAFVPLQSSAISANSRNDFRIDLAAIPESSGLYEIHGLTQNDKWIKIGKVTLTSRLIASEFGDRHLFFQHADR
jgi:hypothetical protein